MFARTTGTVDPAVVAYWSDHYDIDRRLRDRWPDLKHDLDGKIHVIVGTEDTYFLESGARRLKATLDDLRERADVRFVPERDHFDLYKEGDDPIALIEQISWEMYAVARSLSPSL